MGDDLMSDTSVTDEARTTDVPDPAAPRTMTGAMYMAEWLQRASVTRVFGQCGHTNYALIDACHRLGIEYISFRHEQQAAHAADAYFRVSHKIAVLNVHLSPGLTNALTGVISAAADCTPMIVIAGNTPSYHHAREPHQGIRFHADASQGDIYRPLCKRVWRSTPATCRRRPCHERRADGSAGRRFSACRWTCSGPMPRRPSTIDCQRQAAAADPGGARAAERRGAGTP
jgi:hypothetical protein